MSFVLFSSLLYAVENPRIKSINFIGNSALSDHELTNVMIIKPGSIYSQSQLSRDLKSIHKIYHQHGYYFSFIRIDSLGYGHDSLRINVFLSVDEGDQYTLGEVRFLGNKVYSGNELEQVMDIKNNEYLIPENLEYGIDRILSLYERNGYPFAKIEIQNISSYKEEAKMKLRIDIGIDEDQKVTINEIRVSGNKMTSEHVILREIRLKLNELYNQDRVARIPILLNRLNIFSRVDEPELFLSSNGGGLRIRVQEGNTNTFDGVVGYAPPRSTEEKGIVSGLVNVSMRNLFGTARKLNVRWLRDERNSQEIGLQYIEPWVLNFPVNLSGKFNQRQQDTIYVKRGFEIRADFMLTESFMLGLLFAQENIIPSHNISFVSKSQAIFTGVEIQYDTRDDIVSPTSGVNYRSGYQLGRKKISTQSSAEQRLSLDIDFYIPTFQRQVIALGMHGRNLSSSRIDLGDLYRFGGTNTLRGYRENQFLGSRVVWTNLEYRFLMSSRSFAFVFFDSGYYYIPADDKRNVLSNQLVKYGYGLGVRMETAIGNLGLNLAYGEGDSFLQGKIHLGLINEF
ncbi:MAG: POTRA domain-containing protein [Bacteroidota bacterium]|nr:POTRA domain-containing protein [Bacteroidota bacterium]